MRDSAAATKGENQVECRATFELVVCCSLVVGPVDLSQSHVITCADVVTDICLPP